MDMKPSRFTEEQIIGILRKQEAGAKRADMCRKHRFSSAATSLNNQQIVPTYRFGERRVSL
jgi:hypothetical protein